MPRKILATEFVDVVDGCTVTVAQRVVTVKGPRGELTRAFKHLDLEVKMVGEKKMRVDAWFANRKQLAILRTICTHVKNMMTGVTLGYLYKMRFVYAHFPINGILQNNDTEIQIRNFLGEKVIRTVKAYPGVKIGLSKSTKDELTLEGNDIAMVSLTCARIQQSVLVKGKDIRKFLDGIYVSEKTTITVAE